MQSFFSLATLQGIITILMAYLGYHVTLHPPESPRKKWLYKVGFATCGIASVLLTAAQNRQSSETLARIENNTKSAREEIIDLPKGDWTPQNHAFIYHWHHAVSSLNTPSCTDDAGHQMILEDIQVLGANDAILEVGTPVAVRCTLK